MGVAVVCAVKQLLKHSQFGPIPLVYGAQRSAAPIKRQRCVLYVTIGNGIEQLY